MQIEILHLCLISTGTSRTSISATLGPIRGSHVTPTERARTHTHTHKLIQLGQFTITSFRGDLVDVSLFIGHYAPASITYYNSLFPSFCVWMKSDPYLHTCSVASTCWACYGCKWMLMSGNQLEANGYQKSGLAVSGFIQLGFIRFLNKTRVQDSVIIEF
jgi:hypothetical protein